VEEGRRLDPDQVVGLASRDSRGLFWFLRLGLAAATGLIVLVTTALALREWALVVAGSVALLSAWGASGPRLLDLCSEVMRRGSWTYTVRPRPDLTDELPAHRVEPGDYVCRWREDGDRQIRVPLSLVLAVEPDRATGQLLVALATGTTLTLNAAETILRLRAGRRPRTVANGGSALRALLRALPGDGGSINETTAIDPVLDLTDGPTARRALRAAIVGGLVRRRRRLLTWIDDVALAYIRAAGDNWQDVGRTLELTGTGQLWLRADEIRLPPKARLATEPQGSRYAKSRDFFISFASADRSSAEWIAVELETAGYTTVVQSFDFRPGTDFVQQMQQAAATAERTIAVLSPAYFESVFVGAEWGAAFAKDPRGEKGLLIPVRVQPCDPPGLLATRVYVDLVGLDEAAARRKLLAAVDRNRPRPTTTGFPD
jgi:hypothetical protein